MNIYNKEKTQIITNPDLDLGYLIEDTKIVRIVPEQKEVKEQFHYEVLREYPNGGRDLKKVVDIEYKPAIPTHEEKEDILVYIPYNEFELLERKKKQLREWREYYFSIIDCAVWYDTLSQFEKEQVKLFRLQLLDITKTFKYPNIPECIKNRIKLQNETC